MLPADTLDLITTMAQESLKPTSIDHGNGKLLVFKDKSTKYIEPPVVASVRKMGTFDAFASLVNSRGKELRAEPATVDFELEPHIPGHEGSVVYYNSDEFNYHELPSSIHGLRAAFKLVTTEQWKWLSEASLKSYNQIEFVRILRITLRDCLPAGNLLSIIRDVKFTANSTGAGVVNHGRQSMSRDMVEDVMGTGAIPEEVTLKMKPFDNMQFESHIQCAVEVDPSTCSFKLTPYPGQLRKCIDQVLSVAVETLGDSVPCYYAGK